MQCKCSRTSYVLAARCATLVASMIAIQTSLICSQAHAQQFVLVDQTYTANKDNTQDSHFTAELKSGIPTDLKAPVNYAGGSVHVDLEMIEAPSATDGKYNICLENSSDVACLPYVEYKGKGTYKADPKFMAFWQNEKVDWTKGVTKVSLIIKDANEQKVQGSATFYPYKAHVTLTVVAAGSTFDPDATDANPDDGAAGGSAMMGQGGRAGGSSTSAGGKGGSAGKAGGGTSANGNQGGTAAAPKGGSGSSSMAAASGGAGTAATSGVAGASGVTTKPATAPAAAGSSSATTARAAVSRGIAGGDEPQSISSQLEDTSGCSVGGVGTRSAVSAWPLFALGLLAAGRRLRRVNGAGAR